MGCKDPGVHAHWAQPACWALQPENRPGCREHSKGWGCRAGLLDGGDSASPHPGALANVCRPFWLSHLGEECHWHLAGRGLGCCWTSYRAQDGPRQRSMQPHVSTVPWRRAPDAEGHGAHRPPGEAGSSFLEVAGHGHPPRAGCGGAHTGTPSPVCGRARPRCSR